MYLLNEFMKKCVELKKNGFKIDKKFREFVNNCRDPEEYDKRKAEFMKIKTKIGLSEHQMREHCVKENCPSDFCLKLYDKIMKDPQN